MRKNGKEENTGKAQEPFEAAKKPGRGRKPKAEKQQEEMGAAAETEAVQETDTASEKTEEISTEQEAGQEPETAQEAAEMPAAETESTMQESADSEQTGTPPETAPEADTEPGNGTAGESAAEDGNAQEEATGESNGTEESGEMTEEEPERLPAPAMPTQVIDSPLKRMKQEFTARSQIIREQMRNIQNAFITIGFQLHWIRENNMFRVLNYKNVYDYAEKEYGLKKTTCCNFISIIENYAERDENGEVIESIADCYRNYSASQLVAMLGMNEDMRQQVTPDMSVRAINRLRKGEAGTVETSPAPVDEPAPVKEPKKELDAEKDAENPAPEEEPVPEETDREEGPEAGEMQEAENPGTAEGDTDREDEPESTETVEAEAYGDDAGEYAEDAALSEGDTIAEIDSYSDYRSMAEELDLLMRSVFAVDVPVRVKIVCVQG